MTNDIVVNTESIATFSKEVENKSNELKKLLDDMILISNDLDKFFDTPTGKIMKDSLMEYLMNSRKTCDSLNNFGVVLNKSIVLYDTTNSQIAREVGLGD